MNAQLQQLMTYWMQLRPRERVLLSIGAIALLLTLIYLIVWEPVFKQREDLQQSIHNNQQTVQWMQQAVREAKQLQGAQGSRPSGGASLLATIDSTAKQNKLGNAVKRVEPDGASRVRVWMEHAAFDDVVRWLDRLQRSHGVNIDSAVIDRDESQGRVTARFVFSGSA